MLLRFFLSFAIVFTQCHGWAQVTTPFSTTSSLVGKEFTVGRDLGQPLITVNLVNGVREPGVYRIPSTTNLAELLSYAGGSSEGADLTKIYIHRKQTNGNYLSKDFDLMGELDNNEKLPLLNNKDIITISEKVDLSRTVLWITTASLVVGIVASVVAISNNSK